MTRNQSKRSKRGGRLRRAAMRVKKIFSRHSEEPVAREASSRDDREQPIRSTPERRSAEPAAHGRPARRESDIPIDRFDREYLPAQTALRSGFRSDGSELQRGQDLATVAADERWNDEDLFTNRSGDPRIGTHGRSYEAGERTSSKHDEE